MKYLYLFFIVLLVNSECPNLCSGHGTCGTNGVCDCNRQPGLGINKGSSTEVIWTGADCSERLCPKGQSFTYYDLNNDGTVQSSVNMGTLKKLNLDGGSRRQLFESDREMDAGTEESTGEPEEQPTTTVAATTAVPTTTSPPIITEAPITIPPTTQAPTVAEEAKEKSLNKALEGVFEDNDVTTIKSYTISCYKGESGIFLGNMIVNDPNNANVGDLLETLGITSIDEDIYCGTIQIKRKEESAPSFDLLSTLATAPSGKGDFMKADGRKVKTELVHLPLDDVDKSGKILERLRLGGSRRRMLSECNSTADDKIGSFYCIESENPAVSYYYRMKQMIINVICEGSNYELYATAEDVNDIQGPCFFLGDVNIPIQSSEIYAYVGNKGGDYYFGRYNNEATVIVAKEKEDSDYDETTTITLDLQSVPSLIPGNSNSYPYKDRPMGEIELALVEGATIQITPYVDGEFGDTITTTVKSFKYGEGLDNITIVSPVNNPLRPNTTGNSTEEGTDTEPNRMLADNDENDPIYILKIIKNAGPHAFIECSGQGNCNRETGQCECYEGFEGDACQRTSCPNNCNNNGRCVVLTEALGVTNAAVDKPNEDSFDTKLYGCICDEGHRGADCSLYECPSDKDPKGATNDLEHPEYRDCSGRGICDYTTGLCTCFDGFYGTACETTATVQ